MGLAANNLITLTDNGTDNLTLNNSTSSVSQTFTFASKLANGAAYNLTLSATTPTVQPCTSTYGAGTINAANVTNLNVICGQSGGSSTFTGTGPLTTARDYHTATLLSDGRVLVSGGYNGTAPLNSAELYDPATGAWTPTGPLVTQREYHTATLLPNGRVLVSGGYGGTSAGILASAELYDPATGTWTATTGSLATARDYHAATLLPDGRVLVSGGLSAAGYLASAELYDPATGTWTATTGSLVTQRAYHTATLLPNGRVLVSGGYNGTAVLPSAELYW